MVVITRYEILFHPQLCGELYTVAGSLEDNIADECIYNQIAGVDRAVAGFQVAHGLPGVRDDLAVLLFVDTLLNIKQMLFCIVHESSYVFVGVAELLVFVPLKRYLLLQETCFSGQNLGSEYILQENIVGDIYYEQKNDKR